MTAMRSSINLENGGAIFMVKMQQIAFISVIVCKIQMT